jgi:ABC-type uncharacterized transport system ATPase subunit
VTSGIGSHHSVVAHLEGVSQIYRHAVALDAVTLDIPSLRLVGLVGPDGVGKSTLLSLVAGAREIQSGVVAVLGGDMAVASHRAAVCPRIAYMPQGLGKNLYLELSVRDNVDFMARLFGLSSTKRPPRIKELLEATGLHPFPDRPAGKLSGGATPVESQPRWLQFLTHFLPARHFVSFSPVIIYRGGGLSAVWPQFAMVTAVGLGFLAYSLALFRKSIAVTK